MTQVYTIPGICTYFKINADRNVSERSMKPRRESTTCCKVPSLGNTVRLDRIARGLHFESSTPGGGRRVDTTITAFPSNLQHLQVPIVRKVQSEGKKVRKKLVKQVSKKLVTLVHHY